MEDGANGTIFEGEQEVAAAEGRPPPLIVDSPDIDDPRDSLAAASEPDPARQVTLVGFDDCWLRLVQQPDYAGFVNGGSGFPEHHVILSTS